MSHTKLSSSDFLSSTISRLFKHSSHYFVGSALSLLPRFISFPIFTRVLPTADYGILSLLMVTLALSVAVGKLGFQHSAVRFYSDYNRTKPGIIGEFLPTLLIGSVVFSSFVAIIYVIILHLGIIPRSIFPENTLYLFIFISLLIPIRCTIDVCANIFRAEQRTKLYNSFTVTMTYVVLALQMFFLFHVITGLYGIFFGMLLSNILGLLFLFLLFYRSSFISLRYFSVTFLKEVLLFGMPMIFVEIGHTLLNGGDRYLIQYYLGPVSLGIYSAGYNVTTYVVDSVVLPFRTACTPIYLDIWSSRGDRATKDFCPLVYAIFS